MSTHIRSIRPSVGYGSARVLSFHSSSFQNFINSDVLPSTDIPRGSEGLKATTVTRMATTTPTIPVTAHTWQVDLFVDHVLIQTLVFDYGYYSFLKAPRNPQGMDKPFRSIVYGMDQDVSSGYPKAAVFGTSPQQRS